MRKRERLVRKRGGGTERQEREGETKSELSVILWCFSSGSLLFFFKIAQERKTKSLI